MYGIVCASGATKAVVATEKTGLVEKRILSKIQKDHKDLSVIDIWGGIYLSTDTADGGQLLRCHPTFDRYGELFDRKIPLTY
jgi:hypothetical protein